MERKEKIERLIEIRKVALRLAKENIQNMIESTLNTIKRNSVFLVEDIYNSLEEQANNPFCETIKKELDFSQKGINDDVYVTILVNINTDEEKNVEKNINHYIRQSVLDKLDLTEVYAGKFKDKTYIINKNEFENELKKYGLEFISTIQNKKIKYEISVNLEEHTLKIKQN